ncbi:hypothetical protein CSB09_03550 [Candidatus Gracilibacteria bacterium]|nr:MAG: hypothetical protein CSB09_03550 [Candidatus Gracilibacteria bacterium]
MRSINFFVGSNNICVTPFDTYSLLNETTKPYLIGKNPNEVCPFHLKSMKNQIEQTNRYILKGGKSRDKMQAI